MDTITDQGLGSGIEAGAADTTLVLSRRFAAPRELVFAMWSDPRHLRRWCAPRGFDILTAEGEFRPGGSWRQTMRSPEGVEHAMQGHYLLIEPDRRIVQTHAWLDDRGKPGHQTQISISFEDADGGTLITFRQGRFETESGRDAHGGGWTQCLERLDGLLGGEALADVPTGTAVIRTSRRIAAPRARVWAAWTDPEQVGKWWGPRGFTTTTTDWDLRPGGVWRFVMHGPDGTDYLNRVEFEEVTPPARLVYSHRGEDETDHIRFRNTVTMLEVDPNTTQVTMVARFGSLPERNHVIVAHGAVEGGRDTLTRLAEQLEG